MKRITALLLLFALLMFAGCSNTESVLDPEAPAAAGVTENAADQSKAGRTLVVYFTAAENTENDTVTAATPLVDGKGAVRVLAEAIADQTGGDLYAIQTEKSYPVEYNAVTEEARAETDRNERPALAGDPIHPEDYDTVFIGYPIWWYTMPMAVYTFLDTYDLSGKTIIPFSAHEGSGLADGPSVMAELEPAATVLTEGFSENGKSVTNESRKEVAEWLSELDY